MPTPPPEEARDPEFDNFFGKMWERVWTEPNPLLKLILEKEREPFLTAMRMLRAEVIEGGAVAHTKAWRRARREWKKAEAEAPVGVEVPFEIWGKVEGLQITFQLDSAEG